MAPLNAAYLPNGFEPNGTNVLFAHRGEFKGRHLCVVFDAYGNTEVYRSPSIFLNTGLDGHPSQSLFVAGDEDDLVQLISSENAEVVVPKAWGKWEYFFGISQFCPDVITNNHEFENADVFQPLRKDHFRSMVDLFDRGLEEEFSRARNRTFISNASPLRKRDIYANFLRLFLLSKGLALFAAPNPTKIIWFSDSYEGVHSLSADNLVANLKPHGVESHTSNNKFLDVWFEGETVQAHLATSNLFESGILSEDSFRGWYKSSPIHKMRLGLSYFEQLRVSSESYKYLIHLLATNFTPKNGVSYSLALAPWHGRVLRAR